MHAVRALFIFTFFMAITSLGSPAPAVEAQSAGSKPKLTKWVPLYESALTQARKEKKVILAYFSGSDWDPYTQKLDRDVLNTELFRDWAATNVILFRVDFPRDKQLSPNLKSQGIRLRKQMSIVKVPTFILMDNSGLPFARAGFDEAKLRDEEAKGEPKAWIKYLQETIKNRPPDEDLVRQKNLTDCVAYGKKHFLSSVLLITQGRAERTMELKDELVTNQQFVRFVNRNVAYAEIEWPYDSDVSAEAVAFRAFALDQKIEPAPIQLVVYDMQTRKVRAKISYIDPSRIDILLGLIEKQLPRLDYNSGWIEDYREAQAVAQQQKRYIFIEFSSMDSSDFCKKMEVEVFNAPEFLQFARKRLVLLRIDFPAATTQPAALAAQNKIMAEMFAVRGFPSIIVLNPQGRRIADSRYQKGGAEPFLKELNAAIKADEDRTAILMEAQQ